MILVYNNGIKTKEVGKMKVKAKMYDKENKGYFFKEVEFVGEYQEGYYVIVFENEEYVVGEKEIKWN